MIVESCVCIYLLGFSLVNGGDGFAFLYLYGFLPNLVENVIVNLHYELILETPTPENGISPQYIPLIQEGNT
jgi:hypothetical protein